VRVGAAANSGMGDPDVFKIMIASDSHLGYADKDPVRGDDSFAAFEEVLLLSKQQGADFLLLAGDLYHDNKPTRRTMHKSMALLRRYALGDAPVAFEVLSDQAANFPSGRVNYEDPHVAVALPVFSIHGNHDDPTREGGVDALCALDLLSVAGMVNYFGKCDAVDAIDVHPVLLRKGSSRVALYGLGNMRDERLNRMWNQKSVKFLRDAAGRDERSTPYLNIFVLHQNRDLGRGKKNCVHESMIPKWMDVVVWGHEHECQIGEGKEKGGLADSLQGGFNIMQPGSSVATSLVRVLQQE